MLLAAASITACATASAREQLELTVVADGLSYQAGQSLEPPFNSFSSGAMPPTEGANTREYLAIRCDGAWGALKYRLLLPSGPSYTLQAIDDDGLLLQIMEHTVISEDAAIHAMAIHCIDLKPRPVVKSIAKIKLKRNATSSKQLQLANGYILNYRYTP